MNQNTQHTPGRVISWAPRNQDGLIFHQLEKIMAQVDEIKDSDLLYPYQAEELRSLAQGLLNYLEVKL